MNVFHKQIKRFMESVEIISRLDKTHQNLFYQQGKLSLVGLILQTIRMNFQIENSKVKVQLN